MGSAGGEGYTVNLPVPGGSGDAAYRSLVEHVAASLIRTWEPELVLISAGFDAHRDDPLATCRVTEAGFAGMAASLRRAADGVRRAAGRGAGGRLRPRRAEPLDGRGHAGAGRRVDAVAPTPRRVDVHPLARDAVARLSPWWPESSART